MEGTPFNRPTLPKNFVQCGPSTLPLLFSCFFASWKPPVGDNIDDPPDDIRSPEDDVDGVLNLAGENLFVVQEVTVCNRPLCSFSERGVSCRDVCDAENWQFSRIFKLFMDF